MEVEKKVEVWAELNVHKSVGKRVSSDPELHSKKTWEKQEYGKGWAFTITEIVVYANSINNLNAARILINMKKHQYHLYFPSEPLR